MTEIIPTSAALRITGSRQEIELVLEAMARAGWQCKSKQKLYPYSDKGQTKYSLYVNDLQLPDVGCGNVEHRSELRALRGKPALLASQISDLEAELATKREQLLDSLRQLGDEVEGLPRPWDVVLGGKKIPERD